MREYITTIEQLKRVGQKLGQMTEGNYQEFMDIAKNLAARDVLRSDYGLVIQTKKPILIIETELKEPSYYGVTEVVYPIAEFEWEAFSTDPLAKYTPNVYVVDGSKYCAMI